MAARNFLELSSTFQFQKILNGKRRRKITKEALDIIFFNLNEDYRWDAGTTPNALAKMILEQNASKIGIKIETIRRWILAIKYAKDYLQVKDADQRQKMYKKYSATSACTVFRSILEALQKDGLDSWEKVEEAFGKFSKGIEEIIDSQPISKDVLPAESSSGDSIEAEKFAEVANFEDVVAPIRLVYEELQKVRREYKELQNEYSECADDREFYRHQIEGFQLRLSNTIEHVTASKKETEKIKASNEHLADQLKKKIDDHRLAREEIERLKSELADLRKQTPNSLVHQLKELLEMAREISPSASDDPGQAPPVPVSSSSVLVKFELPQSSKFYGKVAVAYHPKFAENFKFLNKKGRKAVAAAVRTVCYHGPNYPSLRVDEVEGVPRKAHIPRNVLRGWASKKFRIVWKFSDSSLMFYDCYNKNNSSI